jgi:hypothetical protein
LRPVVRCPVAWLSAADDTDYSLRIARKLLIEFVGGEPGEMLRDQFA